MNSVLSLSPFGRLLAQAAEDGESLRALQYDLPETGLGWFGLVAISVLVLVYVISLYVVDTKSLSPFWRLWLLVLRLGVFAAIAVIAINPQERTQRKSFLPSRAVIVVDTSSSFGQPEKPAPTGTRVGESVPDGRTRAEAVAELFGKTSLLDDLSKHHEVTVFKFDAGLGPQLLQLRAQNDPSAARKAAEDAANGEAKSPDAAQTAAAAKTAADGKPQRAADVDWKTLLEPVGHETRIGDSLRDLIGQSAGPTLAGIVIVSDGQSNAGIDPESAHDLAKAAKVRLVAVGVGGTEQQANLRVASIQAPSDVHVDDPYEITAFVQSQGLAGRTAQVELLMKLAEDKESDPTLVESREVTLPEDGVPVEVKFERTPTVAGAIQYFVRAKPAVPVIESQDDDNQDEHEVRVVDRKTRVLLLAGGPMRDYHFVRNMLFRHKVVHLDVFLQTVDAATIGRVSQESDKLLVAFPETEAELFEYDVIVGFDPNWKALSSKAIELIQQWVFDHGGGLMLVAGDVYTPELARPGDELQPIRDLYPVMLQPFALEAAFSSSGDSHTSPWPIAFTDAGKNAGFLQLLDDPALSADAWQEFPGVYRCYPTAGTKAGATIYANFSDPRSHNEHGLPVLLAGQFYGSGRTLYLGSAETWRLRTEEDRFDRFWTKLLREIGQGRLKSGGSRAMLLPEKQVYYLGQTVRIRARLLDSQFKPLDAESVPIEVLDPRGKPLVPAPRMIRDRNRPGEFVGDFRAAIRGKYELELTVPESRQIQKDSIQVRLPNLEADHPEQNARLLTELARDTGGRYLRLEEALKELPSLLPVVPREILVDERLRTLWDKNWVLYVLVGLLSAEWLTRKLLKLA